MQEKIADSLNDKRKITSGLSIKQKRVVLLQGKSYTYTNSHFKNASEQIFSMVTCLSNNFIQVSVRLVRKKHHRVLNLLTITFWEAGRNESSQRSLPHNTSCVSKFSWIFTSLVLLRNASRPTKAASNSLIRPCMSPQAFLS